MSATSMPAADGPHAMLVVLVDDEVLVRTTIANMLESGGFKVIPVANADEALEVLAAVPDVRAVVTDVKLASSSMDGFALAQRVWAERRIGVLVISGNSAPTPADLPPEINFIAKPVYGTTLVHLVRDLIEETYRPRPGPHASEPKHTAEEKGLTRRQKDVLELLVEGKSNNEIGQALGLSENTVKVHVAALFRALGASSRIEAILTGIRLLQPK